MTRHSTGPTWGLLIFGGAALVLSFLNLAGFLMNDDEGTYLYSAWRIGLGEVPYRDFTVVQTPLGFYLGAAAFKLFGPTVAAARALSVAFMLGTSILLYAAARRYFHLERGYALAAAGIFLFNKHVFFLGRSFMPDVPMIFFGTAALFAALRGEDDGAAAGTKRKAAFIAGVFAGLAALAKLNGALVFAGYIGYLIFEFIRQSEARQDAVMKIAWAAAGFLAMFGATFGLLLAYVPGTYDAVIGFHAAKEAASGLSYWGLLGQRLAQAVGNHNYGLAAGVIAVLLLGRKYPDRRRVLLWIIAGGALAALFLPSRFFLRYAVFAAVPFALLFGLGVKLIWERKTIRRIAGPILAFLVLLCLAPTLSPKKILARDPGTRAVASFIREHTLPGDFVFGDDPFLNFLARRPCPPGLVDVSEAMVTGGRIDAAAIIDQCERLGVKLIFVEKGASAHHLIKLNDYAKFQNYLNEKFQPAENIRREFLDVELYLRRRLP
jgi:hypothetical protein